ncbi:CE1759 family FMN reductase [Streptosporangium sp. NPDC002524]|uniref:CE1759 family FMN reductase n=1 Tax=Streptosporangium sp. NPDC002524 TaxID=3154537 RepID=UPI00332B1C66
MTSLVVISAGLSNPSSTRLPADRLATATAETFEGLDVTHVELRGLAHQLTDQLLTGFPAPEPAAAEQVVREADGLIVVTPVFSASHSGLFKTFFDVLETVALDGTPVLLAATAGTARHSLVIEHALRPLFAYLHAVTVPTGVFAATSDFAGTDLGSRVLRAAGELAVLMGRTGGSSGVVAGRRHADADLAAATPFDHLLRQAGAPSSARTGLTA